MLVLSIFGFIGPNGVFLYVATYDSPLFVAASLNPIAQALMFEAFFLTALLAWLIARFGNPRPGWPMFIVMSLVGSLACSVPGFLFLASRYRRLESGS